MRVLGIDPGTRITGFGCVEGDQDRPRLIDAGVFRLLKVSKELGPRLVELERDLDALLAVLRPDVVAVEGLFVHYKHPATAIMMGHARGVIVLAVQRAGPELVEFKPAEVKKSLVGHGQASKAQMQDAIRRQFGLESRPEPADVADALAIALCALRRPAIEIDDPLARVAP